MQLRSQKKYQGYGRRRLFGFPHRLFKLALVVALIWIGNWIVRYPELVRFIITDSAYSAQEGLSNASEKIFPPAPTATPDVREEAADGTSAYRSGDVQNTIDNYRQAIWGSPNDVEMHYLLAHLLTVTSNFGADTEKLTEALTVAQRGINADPESPLGWTALAMALDWSQDYEGALAAGEHAQELAPNSPLVKGVLANIYRNVEQYGMAEEVLLSAIATLSQDPNPSPEAVAQVYRNYGRYLLTQGDFEGAKQAYNIAYQALPNETYIAVELATRVYANANVRDYASAIVLLQGVRDSNPGDPTILYWLANSYLMQGELESEMEVLTTCAEANPDYLACVSALGHAQYRQQLYVPAAENLKHATELGSTDPYDWYLLGRSYYFMDRCGEALLPLQKGYQLVQETPVEAVTVDNFRSAAEQCSLVLE